MMSEDNTLDMFQDRLRSLESRVLLLEDEVKALQDGEPDSDHARPAFFSNIRAALSVFGWKR